MSVVLALREVKAGGLQVQVTPGQYSETQSQI